MAPSDLQTFVEHPSTRCEKQRRQKLTGASVGLEAFWPLSKTAEAALESQTEFVKLQEKGREVSFMESMKF